MSTTLLYFISEEPTFVPKQDNQDKAKNYLESIFKENVRELKFTNGDMDVVGPGEDFDSISISCNACNKSIEFEYWANLFNQSEKSHFTNLHISTPCCGKETSLNNLLYSPTIGFAKFIISIRDPNTDLESNNLKELETLLGTKIKKIWAHF